MTPAEEVQECRHKLGMDRTSFGRALGLGPRGYAQVRKWEEGVGAPSAGTMQAMRLLVELEEAKRLPFMSPPLWDMAQIALDDLKAMLGNAVMREERKSLTYAIQVLRALLTQRPK
jgi:transcriptional regulator with XRE-family HTH domain